MLPYEADLYSPLLWMTFVCIAELNALFDEAALLSCGCVVCQVLHTDLFLFFLHNFVVFIVMLSGNRQIYLFPTYD